MPKVKLNVTTEILIKQEKEKLETSLQKKSLLEAQIKESKAKIAELEIRLTNEKLQDIKSLAAENGISLDTLLNNLKNGTLLDILKNKNNSSSSTSTIDESETGTDTDTDTETDTESISFPSDDSDDTNEVFKSNSFSVDSDDDDDAVNYRLNEF